MDNPNLSVFSNSLRRPRLLAQEGHRPEKGAAILLGEDIMLKGEYFNTPGVGGGMGRRATFKKKLKRLFPPTKKGFQQFQAAAPRHAWAGEPGQVSLHTPLPLLPS